MTYMYSIILLYMYSSSSIGWKWESLGRLGVPACGMYISSRARKFLRVQILVIFCGLIGHKYWTRLERGDDSLAMHVWLWEWLPGVTLVTYCLSGRLNDWYSFWQVCSCVCVCMCVVFHQCFLFLSLARYAYQFCWAVSWATWLLVGLPAHLQWGSHLDRCIPDPCHHLHQEVCDQEGRGLCPRWVTVWLTLTCMFHA